MRRISADQRRARLAVRHHLTASSRADDPVDVARDLVGLHGTDPATVHLAAAARMAKPDVATVERALYDERTLVRMLGMRRTMFIEPLDLAPVIQASCTNAIAVTERRKLVQHLAQYAEGIDDPEHWLADVERSTLEALRARGEALGAELTADEPRLRTKLHYRQADTAVVTRVLFLLAAEGRIIRGRPRGSWISGQFRWAPIDAWLPGGMPELPTEAAKIELARRWLRSFGPATVADLKWWTGWTLGDVKRALASIDPVEVDLDGEPGIALSDELEPAQVEHPWLALLPALDPTVMGWQRREWFLGDHGPTLFDTNGNAGPTVWCNGRVIGGWAQRRDGEIVIRLLEDPGTDATVAIQAEAARLATWLGPVRVTPRFRTPLERTLTA
jgi:Winged helix DNA-binding domain